MQNDKVVGLFSNYKDANDAVSELMNNGYSKNDLDLVGKKESFNMDNNGENMGEDTVAGATAGAVIGGIAGLVAGVAALTIPGVGPIITLGTLTAALGSTAVGAAGGGAIGGLIGLTEEEGVAYEQALAKGSILVIVKPKGDVQMVKDVFSKHNAMSLI